MEGDIINQLPPEQLLQILSYVSVKELMKLRLVCLRWRDVINDASLSDYFWKRKCQRDFGDAYQVAHTKRQPGLDWMQVYRSLSLWPRLTEAEEYQNELCNTELIKHEIRSFEILRNGIIGVHTRSAIVYYSTETLAPLKRSHIHGDFLKYGENDRVTAVLSYHMFLFIRKKLDRRQRPVKATFDEVKTFILLDNILYYISVRNVLYLCRLDRPQLVSELIVNANKRIVSVGMFKGQMHILTLDQCIYAVKNKKLSLVTTVESSPNLLTTLRHYNLVELLDWRTYFQWIFIMKKCVTRGPLEEILVTQVYGDVVLVGCNWGNLLIYYKPYKDGELDIFNTEPIKKFNFMEWLGNFVHCMHPVLMVDAQETRHGHNVIVATPNKVIIISFTHNFETAYSTSVIEASTSGLSGKK